MDFNSMRKVRVLGDGGFGTVKLVEDLSTHDFIALKSFNRPSNTDSTIGVRFKKEIEKLIHLAHPCILEIAGYSLPTATERARIGTVFAVNGSLRDAFNQRQSGLLPKFLDDTGMAIIASGIVLGMRFAHSRCVIHRDLKPENILIDHDGLARIGDLGSNGFVDLKVTVAREAGAPLYTAPEIYLGGGFTNAVDVFSFALVLYELLLGKRAFPPDIGLRAMMDRAAGQDRPELPEAMNEVVRTIITRCWSADPTQRESFDEILTNFEQIQFQITPNVDTARVAAFVSSVRDWESL